MFFFGFLSCHRPCFVIGCFPYVSSSFTAVPISPLISLSIYTLVFLYYVAKYSASVFAAWAVPNLLFIVLVSWFLILLLPSCFVFLVLPVCWSPDPRSSLLLDFVIVLRFGFACLWIKPFTVVASVSPCLYMTMCTQTHYNLITYTYFNRNVRKIVNNY